LNGLKEVGVLHPFPKKGSILFWKRSSFRRILEVLSKEQQVFNSEREIGNRIGRERGRGCPILVFGKEPRRVINGIATEENCGKINLKRGEKQNNL